jgi:regulator of protease activity HflC (stomatin/prohibitin superfamily)
MTRGRVANRSTMEPLVSLIVIIGAIALVGWIVWLVANRFIGRATIHDYERGLRYQNGTFVGLLDAGSHLYLRPTTEIRVVDIRPGSTTIGGQEVLTSDGVAVKVSLVVRSVVGDPVAMLTGDRDAMTTLYLAVQLGLREVVARQSIEEVLAARTTLGPEIAELVAGRMAGLGIEVLGVDVRDVMVPSELKRAFSAVVAARREGAASLERARGETAALRGLANAGRLVADNPGLLSLRVVQELSAGGNTVMIGLGDGVAGAGTGPGPLAASSRGRRATDRAATIRDDGSERGGA